MKLKVKFELVAHVNDDITLESTGNGINRRLSERRKRKGRALQVIRVRRTRHARHDDVQRLTLKVTVVSAAVLNVLTKGRVIIAEIGHVALALAIVGLWRIAAPGTHRTAKALAARTARKKHTKAQKNC